MEKIMIVTMRRNSWHSGNAGSGFNGFSSPSNRHAFNSRSTKYSNLIENPKLSYTLT